MIFVRSAFLFVLLAGTSAVSVGQEAEFYVEAVSTSQGPLPGDAMAAGLEDQIRGFQFHAQAAKPIGADGRPNGPIQFRPITFVKPVDASTPLFDRAVVTSEFFPSITFTFYRESPASGRQPYYRVELTDATVVDTRTWSPDPEVPSASLQSVGVTFDQITWTSFDENGSTLFETTASWSSSNPVR